MYKVVFCIFFQLEISNIWTEEKNVMFSFTGLVLDALLQIRLEQSLKGLHLVVTRTSSPSVQDGISGSVTATMDLRESIKNQTDVALGITRQLLLNEGKNKNMVYSIAAVHPRGSKGHTQDEMLTFLKSKSTDQLNDLADGSPSGGPCLSYANGVWVEKSLPVKVSFKQVLDNADRAVLKQVDFKAKYEEARCEVNFWAEKETRGLIKDLLLHGTVGSYTCKDHPCKCLILQRRLGPEF